MRGLQYAIFMPFMFHAAMAAFLEKPAKAARSWLFECSDAGPWACEEEGCPASSLDCSMLASLGVCPTAFGHVWQQPPQGLANVLVQERCPLACSRCGTPVPEACNMAVIDARELSEDALVSVLLGSDVPVVVRSWQDSSSFGHILDEHGDVPIDVILEGGRYRGESTTEEPMALADYAAALRNASLPDSAYVFTELGGVDVSLGGFALGGPNVSAPARHLFAQTPELGQLLAAALARQNAELSAVPHRTDGRVLLSAGTWGNGRPFHQHGPALFALVAGVKRWFVRRPNASFAWQTFEIPRETLLAADALPNDWSEQLWQCAQRPGELVWVPDLQQHATLNHAAWTIGLTMVMDVVAPLSPLHEAVQAGDAAEVRQLLARGVNTEAAAPNGGTALHYAAGLGHCEALDALLVGGASLQARARQGLTPLHMAVAGGHREAVELLLRRGAEVNARNQHGLTPRDLALQLGHVAVAQRLADACLDLGTC
jgi:hypothetical protein